MLGFLYLFVLLGSIVELPLLAFTIYFYRCWNSNIKPSARGTDVRAIYDGSAEGRNIIHIESVEWYQ